MKRRPYCLIVLAAALMAAVASLIGGSDDLAVLILAAVLALAAVVGFFVAAWLRGSDIGQSRLWNIALVLPIINLIACYRLWAFPTGYAQHRTPDRAMRVVTGFYIAWGVLLVAAIAIPALQKREVSNRLEREVSSPASTVSTLIPAASEEEMIRLTTASRDRAFLRYPVFADKNGAWRKALDVYVDAALKDPSRAAFFGNANWPELIVEELVARKPRFVNPGAPGAAGWEMSMEPLATGGKSAP